MMNTSEALEKINEYLKEVDSLRQLRHGSRDYVLWQDKVKYVLEAAFRKESDEYNKFYWAGNRGSWPMNPTEEWWQKAYQEDLTRQETALLSINNKYKIIGMPSSDNAAAQVTNHPKAFIAHGGESQALMKLKEFLRALGVEPLVVEEQASKAKSVDDKVEYYMSLADCAIILATADDKVDGKWYPRQNVAHETGLAQKTFGDKIIYLKEEGAEFPSNIKPKVWEPFTQQYMDRAFIAVAREMKAFGLIQATPPSQKATNA